MKNNKTKIFIIGIVAVLIIVIIIYFAIKKTKPQDKDDKKNSKTEGSKGQTIPSVRPTIGVKPPIFTLKRKSPHKEAVRYLQQALNYIAKKRGLPKSELIKVDGDFGGNTEVLLKKLFRTIVVNKATAQQISREADLPEFANIIDNYFK